MRPEFELNHLKYFYYTVLEGGVAQAATRLHVQQPVVSKMLGSLVERFGEPLFRKAGRKKILTDFGQLIYRHCQNIFHEIEKLNSVYSKDVRLSGPINFGSTESAAGIFLAQSVQQLLEKFPELHPNVYCGTASHLIELISQKKLEFGLFFHLPQLPVGLEIIHKIPIRYHVVVHKKFSRNTDIIEKFIGSREIDDTATYRFPTLDRLKRDYPKPRIAFSTNNLHFHKDLVLNGFGSAVLPYYMIESELKQKKLHDLYAKEKIYFDLKIVAPKGQSLSLASNNLIQNIVLNFTAEVKRN